LLINILLSLIVIGLIWFTFSLDKLWPFLLPKPFMVTAWPLIITRTILILFSAVTLARHSGSTGAQGDPAKKPVTSGPYRWIRNPIYLGDEIIILGLAFLTQSPSLFTALIIFMVLIAAYSRKVEEPGMERRFGEAYRQYKQGVPRWFPRIRRAE
jgi:protein-S-isoprenylcysteine O-methyltransferase Ste14